MNNIAKLNEHFGQFGQIVNMQVKKIFLKIKQRQSIVNVLITLQNITKIAQLFIVEIWMLL